MTIKALNTLNNLERPDKPKRKLKLYTPAEMVKVYTESLKGDIDRPLTTCIPSFDLDLRRKLRGTVGAYIGYGGTKKSLLALQACKDNVQQHFNNCTGIYSNMEMAPAQFMSRLIDMSFTVDDWSDNASWYFETQFTNAYKKKDEALMRQVEEVLSKYFTTHYGNNLYVNSDSSLRVEDFHEMVKEAKEENGKVDMLVIDGLSMMAGIGTETESYTTNSKELKDLAKEHSIFIPLICHLSKGAEKDTRDIQRHIRGSEKILDNVDFIIQMSLIKDENRNGQYLTDKGYIRFFNKRGSGNTINVIYNFDKATLTITESKEAPEVYDNKKTSESW
jgi:replicative DNA helicase